MPGCGAISNCVPRSQPEQAQAYIAYTFFAVPQTNASGVWPLSTRDEAGAEIGAPVDALSFGAAEPATKSVAPFW